MSELTEQIASLPETIGIEARTGSRPTLRQWLLHAALFVATAITTTISGIIWCAGPEVDATGPASGQSGAASD